LERASLGRNGLALTGAGITQNAPSGLHPALAEHPSERRDPAYLGLFGTRQHTVYGRLPVGPMAKPGSYTDSAMVVLTY
jgi:hypothetical protein